MAGLLDQHHGAVRAERVGRGDAALDEFLGRDQRPDS